MVTFTFSISFGLSRNKKKRDTANVADAKPSQPPAPGTDVPLPVRASCEQNKGVLASSASKARADAPPRYTPLSSSPMSTAPLLDTIERRIDSLSSSLRDLSLSIHAHPQIAWKERHAHDVLTEYMEKQEGWKVERHIKGIETAWSATWTSEGFDEKKHRTIGFQSEMDALPGIGQACGHNLIAISGVASALGTVAALKKGNIIARVILLGTPAEEGGGGKILLLERGAYKDMDACMMLHPMPTSGVGPWLAVTPVKVAYKGKTAHAGAAPWEGVNALDAAVLAYSNISALRQQIKPTDRVHGIIGGNENWAPNVIPDYATLFYNVRSSTIEELEGLRPRVDACFRAAATSTGCEVDIDWGMAYYDVTENLPLGRAYIDLMEARYGEKVPMVPWNASTDFGNVSHALPGLHAAYAILPGALPPGSGNHTSGFATAAATIEAHERTLDACVVLAGTACTFLCDDAFAEEVKAAFKI